MPASINHRASLIILFLISSYTLIGQKRSDLLDFKKVDSFILTVKYDNNYTRLAKDLTAIYKSDIYKIRAIFKWITENIAFDYSFINRGSEITKPECDGKFNCIEILRSWENGQIKKMLKSRKATAEGYAKIFKKLCDICMIQNEIVPGYLKTRPYQIGNRLPVNHIWNAVFIDTAWFFFDASCAAGICPEDEESGKLTGFIKKFSNYYWLLSFEKLTRNHYPQNEVWAEKHNLTKDDFFNKPHYYSTEILENISSELPDSGFLTLKKGDTIHFSFDYKKNIREIQINSNLFRNPPLWTTVKIRKKTKIIRDKWAEKKQVYIPFERKDNNYTFDYKINDASLYYLELTLDHKPAVRYRIKVESR